MNILLTGCAGFIGSNLTDELLQDGHYVVGVDNFSTGQKNNLQKAMKFNSFEFYSLDLMTEIEKLFTIKTKIDIIIHLSANADIRFGSLHPMKDLEQNVIVTQNILEFARKKEVKKLIFSSTGAVYGEPNIFPTPENVETPIQTSLYGASKISAEGFIQAYCETFKISAIIYRFVSILGPRYSHGHVFDFYNQLKLNPLKLRVLGDGSQTKSYLHVHDCIEAIKIGINQNVSKSEIYNLGTEETCTVKNSIEIICRYLNLDPKVEYGNTKKGWIGDNPFILLDISKMKKLGWSPKYDIEKSITDTVAYLHKNS